MLPRCCLECWSFVSYVFRLSKGVWALYNLGLGATGPWPGWTGQINERVPVCQHCTDYVLVKEMFFKSWGATSENPLVLEGGLWRYLYNLKPFSWQAQGEVYFSQHAALGRRNGLFLKADLTCGWALFHMFPIRDARESRYSMATLLSFSVVRWNNGAFVVTSA